MTWYRDSWSVRRKEGDGGGENCVAVEGPWLAGESGIARPGCARCASDKPFDCGSRR
jgi:hypothetical protein